MTNEPINPYADKKFDFDRMNLPSPTPPPRQTMSSGRKLGWVLILVALLGAPLAIVAMVTGPAMRAAKPGFNLDAPGRDTLVLEADDKYVVYRAAGINEQGWLYGDEQIMLTGPDGLVRLQHEVSDTYTFGTMHYQSVSTFRTSSAGDYEVLILLPEAADSRVYRIKPSFANGILFAVFGSCTTLVLGAGLLVAGIVTLLVNKR